MSGLLGGIEAEENPDCAGEEKGNSNDSWANHSGDARVGPDICYLERISFVTPDPHTTRKLQTTPQTTISSRSSSATRGAFFRPLSVAKSTRPASVRLMMSS